MTPQWALRTPSDEIEWARPELAACAVTIDLGPVRWDDLIAYRQTVSGLLVAAIEVVARLLREQAAELDTPEVLALARVVHLVSSAYQRVTGHLP